MTNRIFIASLLVAAYLLAAPLAAQTTPAKAPPETATAKSAAPPAAAPPKTFDSPESVAQALIDASANHDSAKLAAIFGPQGQAILTSGNASQDKAEQTEFATLARTKHQLQPDPRNPNRVLLSIGDEDWPFPVPIVKTDGKWSFDSSESKVEMQARRIGTDELDVIEICSGYVEAQRKFASEDRDKNGLLEYATRMMSSPGKHDGLYWPDTPEPLVPRGLAEATREGSEPPGKPYHGYYFRILSSQGDHAPGGAHTYVAKNKLIGGFGLVAWPAQYGVSGIHTFIVNQDGIVFQKDIAPPAAAAPVPITRYDPDPTWTPVD